MRDEWFNFYSAIHFTNSSFGAFLETAHCWMEETAGCVDLACKSATCSWSDLIASSIWTLTLPVLPAALSCRRESKTNGSHMHEMNLNDFFFLPAGRNKDLDDDRKGDEALRSPSSPVPSDRTGVRADAVNILTDSLKNECNR